MSIVQECQALLNDGHTETEMNQPTETERANAVANVIRGVGILCLVAMAFRLLPLGFAVLGAIAFFILSVVVRKKLLAQAE